MRPLRPGIPGPMKITTLKAILFLAAFTTCNPPANSQHNDVEAGLYNIGIGSVLGGIGALINKKSSESTSKTFLKGLTQGALGGYMVFESKRLLRDLANEGDYSYVWPSKLVNSAGTSIIENAAANRNFWERWHLHLGFNRIEISTKDQWKLKYRILPASFATTLYFFTNSRFNLHKSLQLGTVVFSKEEISIREDMQARGAAATNVIVLRDDLSSVRTEAHELVHTYQYESFSGINSFLEKPSYELQQESSFFKAYSRIFHTDFNAALTSGLYSIENLMNREHRDNLFEKEAYYFTY